MLGTFDEFYNENRFRKYPFEDAATCTSVAGVSIPTGWLVDCKVVVHGRMQGLVYLRSINFTTSLCHFADTVTRDDVAYARLGALIGNEPHAYLHAAVGYDPAGVMTFGVPDGCDMTGGKLVPRQFHSGELLFEPEATTLVPAAMCVLEQAGVRGIRMPDGTVFGLGQRSITLTTDGVLELLDEGGDIVVKLNGAALSEKTKLERCNPTDPEYPYPRTRIKRVRVVHTDTGVVSPILAVRKADGDDLVDGAIVFASRNDLLSDMRPCAPDGLPDSSGNLPDTRGCGDVDPAPVAVDYGPAPDDIVVPVARSSMQLLTTEEARKYLYIGKLPGYGNAPSAGAMAAAALAEGTLFFGRPGQSDSRRPVR